MSKIIREDVGEFYQHYPKLALAVTARYGVRRNAMTAAWHTSISFRPPLYGVAISTKRSTYELIVKSREFGINFLPYQDAELLARLGGTSGKDIDKFRQFGVETEDPVKTSVPIIKSAYCAYECKLVSNRVYGDHHLMVGEVVAVHWLKEAFTPEQVLDLERFCPALYLGRELYITAAKEPVKHLEREVYGVKEGK